MSDETPTDHAIEALRDLLQHPGWKLLLNHAHLEWGPVATLQRCRREEQAERMPQVIAVSDGITTMLAWPVNEIDRLAREQEKAKRELQRRENPPLVARRA